MSPSRPAVGWSLVLAPPFEQSPALPLWPSFRRGYSGLGRVAFDTPTIRFRYNLGTCAPPVLFGAAFPAWLAPARPVNYIEYLAVEPANVTHQTLSCSGRACASATRP